MKVNCGPYIHGVRVRLGYSPNGGTIIVKTKAIRTKLDGKTIYKKARCKENLSLLSILKKKTWHQKSGQKIYQKLYFCVQCKKESKMFGMA